MAPMLRDDRSTLNAKYGFRFADYDRASDDAYRRKLQELFPLGSDIASIVADLKSAGATCEVWNVAMKPDKSIEVVFPATGVALPRSIKPGADLYDLYGRSKHEVRCRVERYQGASSVRYGVLMLADPDNRLLLISGTIGIY